MSRITSSPPLPAVLADTARDDWRPSGLLWGTAAILLLALFADTLGPMVRTWREDSAYGHGFVILPLALWLAWERRRALDGLSPQPGLTALALFAAALAAWAAGRVSSTLALEQLGLVGMLQSLAVAVAGWRAARAMALPLLFLLFAVPLGQSLVPDLQRSTAGIAVTLLRWTGIPVHADALIITLPSGRFEVAEACSGLRFLTATLAASVAVSGLLHAQVWKHAAFLALGAVVAVVGNGLRAFGIILLAHVSNHTIAVSVDHLLYGWLFFSLLLGVLVGLAWYLRDRPAAVPPPLAGAVRRRSPPMGRAIIAIAAALVMAAAAHLHLSRPAGTGTAEDLAGLAAAVPPLPWPSRPADPAWAPRADSAAAQRLETVVVDGRPVQRFAALFAPQRQGAEAVGSEPALVPAGWSRTGPASATLLPGTSVLTLAGPGGKRLVAYWYWVDGRQSAHPVAAKLAQACATLWTGRSRAALVALSAALDPDDDPAAAVSVLSKALAAHSVASLQPR